MLDAKGDILKCVYHDWFTICLEGWNQLSVYQITDITQQGNLQLPNILFLTRLFSSFFHLTVLKVYKLYDSDSLSYCYEQILVQHYSIVSHITWHFS